jgi:hypothetical protein
MKSHSYAGDVEKSNGEEQKTATSNKISTDNLVDLLQ